MTERNPHDRANRADASSRPGEPAAAPPQPFDPSSTIDPEIVSPHDRLWHRLRKGQLLGLRFLPDHKIAGTIVDFYCQDAGMVIVCTRRDDDNPRERMEAISSLGLKTLRFTPADINGDIGGVLETILEVASVRLSRRPYRSRGGATYMRE